MADEDDLVAVVLSEPSAQKMRSDRGAPNQPLSACLTWRTYSRQDVGLTFHDHGSCRDVFAVDGWDLVLKLQKFTWHDRSNKMEAALAKTRLRQCTPAVYGCVKTNWQGCDMSVLVMERVSYSYKEYFEELTARPADDEGVVTAVGMIEAFVRLVCFASGDLGYCMNDLHWKNVGVTREGRVVFLDFEGLALDPQAGMARKCNKGVRAWKTGLDGFVQELHAKNSTWFRPMQSIASYLNTWWPNMRFPTEAERQSMCQAIKGLAQANLPAGQGSDAPTTSTGTRDVREADWEAAGQRQLKFRRKELPVYKSGTDDEGDGAESSWSSDEEQMLGEDCVKSPRSTTTMEAACQSSRSSSPAWCQSSEWASPVPCQSSGSSPPAGSHSSEWASPVPTPALVSASLPPQCIPVSVGHDQHSTSPAQPTVASSPGVHSTSCAGSPLSARRSKSPPGNVSAGAHVSIPPVQFSGEEEASTSISLAERADRRHRAILVSHGSGANAIPIKWDRGFAWRNILLWASGRVKEDRHVPLEVRQTGEQNLQWHPDHGRPRHPRGLLDDASHLLRLVHPRLPLWRVWRQKSVSIPKNVLTRDGKEAREVFSRQYGARLCDWFVQAGAVREDGLDPDLNSVNILYDWLWRSSKHFQWPGFHCSKKELWWCATGAFKSWLYEPPFYAVRRAGTHCGGWGWGSCGTHSGGGEGGGQSWQDKQQEGGWRWRASPPPLPPPPPPPS